MFSPDDALGSILVKTTELGGHVGERGQTVGVEVLVLLGMETQTNATAFPALIAAPLPSQAAAYPRPSHVELDGADDHQDEQTAEGDLRQRPLRVPRDVFQYLCEWEGAKQLQENWHQVGE